MSKADRTREQIIKAAAAAIRTEGPDRIGVASVMARVKLTHGGFYAHFSSKDDLVQAALQQAFDEIHAKIAALTEGKTPPQSLSRVIDWYVSAEMRDDPERACPLTTSAGDARRFPAAGHARMSEGVAWMADRVEQRLRQLGRTDPEAEALSVVSEMVGAVSLARAMTDPKRSDQILAATRNALKARLNLPAR